VEFEVESESLMSKARTERDFLGTLEIPAEALWGAHTARAAVSFPFSGHRLGDARSSKSKPPQPPQIAIFTF
jgi:hypothetical protein